MINGKFDGQAFYAALDAERQSRGLNWKKLAGEAGVQASTLTRMSQGRNPDVNSLAALCEWSGLKVEAYTRTGPIYAKEASSLAQISTLLRADPKLSQEGVKALEAIISTAYKQMRKE